VVEEIIGSTGLELKSDPGVPLVYAGFGALMITTLISYISHSQVSSRVLKHTRICQASARSGQRLPILLGSRVAGLRPCHSTKCSRMLEAQG